MAAELGADLKTITVELEHLKVLSEVKPLSIRKAPPESMERRVGRLRERLAQGGEVAQGVVRELFPYGVWLSRTRTAGASYGLMRRRQTHNYHRSWMPTVAP